MDCKMGGMKYDIVEMQKRDESTSHGKIIAQIKPNSTVLECGCATGYMTKWMKEQLHCKVSIIEIDEACFQIAKAYAEDGFCGDLNQDEWLAYFSGQTFDYILFPDVLEHLPDPLKVLSHVTDLLKDNGKIIISIPNIAHNDIIMKLVDDHFDYTATGLLDNTHIHFWGKKNLEAFCQNAGLSIIHIDGTIAPFKTTEQSRDNYKAVDCRITSGLEDRALGNIYQYVFVCQKTDYVKEHEMKCMDLLPPGKSISHFQMGTDVSVCSTVYYSNDDAFQQEHSNSFFQSINTSLPGEIEINIKLPQNCRKIRFDPCEGNYCLVENMYIICGEKILSFVCANGDSVGTGYLFSTTDPRFFCDIPLFSEGKAETSLTIRCNLTIFDEIKEKEIDSFLIQWHERDLLHHQIEKLNVRIEELQSANQQLFVRCKHAEDSYAIIANSFFWKTTKPARAVLDWVKKEARKNERVYLFLQTVKWTLRYGPKEAGTRRKIAKAELSRKHASKNWPTNEELEQQKAEKFPRDIKFSILVPLYNTPEKFLKEMIESVQRQSYQNWELCLADGSDAEHITVGTICQQYAKKDHRILYKKLEKNLGISGNTNACIDMASGDYIALFDHDDILHPSALFEVMKAICDKDADFVYTDENTFQDKPSDAYCPNFKPDFAPDTLRSNNYICHLSVFSKSLLEDAGGGFRSEFDGSQDYDMILRLTEKARRIVHIPQVLYYWRSHPSSVASDVSAKPYTMTAAKKALAEHLKRAGLAGTVEDSRIPTTYHIKYEIAGNPKISIIIPNKDHIDDLSKCINSILEKTTWKNWEIIVVENNSTDSNTFQYYNRLRGMDNRIRVIAWKEDFNFSAICNYGASQAAGEYLLMLNNDIEVITPNWLEEMLMFAQRKDVGMVGAMLYYPDDTVQHAGVILGIGGVGGHSHKYLPRASYGYMSRLCFAQNLSAVTAACALIPKRVWDQVHGFDEEFAVAFNDVDLCMRIRKAGYLIVWTPYAELYHYESKSRGPEDTPEKQKRFSGEVIKFQNRWSKELEAGDPYYNPNLTLEREDFSLN